MKKDIFVILGMHRSGTSALTRVLNLMGLKLGDDLVPAEADNPKGFWEDARIVAIHDRFLESIGRDSADPRIIAAERWDSPWASQARADILQVLSTYDRQQLIWGVKDPRLCRLMPLWRPIFEQINRTPRFLMTFRNPLEVAGSLFAREQLPLHRGLLLWLVYNLDAIVQTRNDGRVIVSFNQFLSDWPSITSKVRASLDSTWLPEDTGVKAAIESFLDPHLRHHRAPDPTRPGEQGFAAVDSLLLMDWIASAYAMLREAAVDADSAIDPDTYSLADRVYDRLTKLETLSENNEAPHYHRWFSKDTAWDAVQRADLNLAQRLAGLRVPLTGLLGPYYRARKVLSNARMRNQ